MKALKALLVLVTLLLSCAAMPDVRRSPPSTWSASRVRTLPRVNYSPSQPGRRIAVVYLDTAINNSSAVAFDVHMKALIGADEIVVEIDSLGGDTQAALAIGSSIARAPAPVTCIVTNTAASAAFLILQMCPTRLAEKDATLMIHHAKWSDPLPDLFQELQRAPLLTAINRQLAFVGCAKMNMSVDDCHRRFLDGDWWMTADEALNVAAVDGLIASAKAYEEIRRYPMLELEGFAP